MTDATPRIPPGAAAGSLELDKTDATERIPPGAAAGFEVRVPPWPLGQP